ncbi:hypothetical protein [Flavobacterium sp. MK4S-17]|uniref:hypothetical protein n=1 Tax=Flavobacterium sp. MK4S-17 TaxID=2543737 RepID=UPI00135CA15B|nr:hypothetical protein [Flavobacterium sp. MK4S-17]
MKPLQSMNNVDKGKLLATLFPEQVQGILDSLTAAHSFLNENEETLRSTWENTLLPLDFWLQLAEQAREIINHYGQKLAKSTSLFSDQLFDGYIAIFTIDCIVKHAASVPPLPENSRYRLAVQLLFNHYTASP